MLFFRVIEPLVLKLPPFAGAAWLKAMVLEVMLAFKTSIPPPALVALFPLTVLLSISRLRFIFEQL